MTDIISTEIGFDGNKAFKGMAQFQSILEQVRRSSTINTAEITRGLNGINNVQLRSNLLNGLTKELERSRRDTERALKDIKGNFDSLPRPVSTARLAVASFAGTIAAMGFTALINGLRSSSAAFMDFSDKAGSIQAKLTLATQKVGDFATAQRDVSQIANDSRADLTSVADLYSTISRNSGTLALSQKQVAVATKTVGMALKIGGQGAAQNSAAILQLSQAMGTGKLAGDEFASLAENAPRLMDLFADAIGKPRGELKKLASDGKITAAVIAKALTDPKLVAAIQAEYAKIPVSFADIKTAASNAGITIAGAFSQGANVGNGLRNALQSIQDYVKANQQTFVEWGIRARYAFSALADGAAQVWSIIGPVLTTIGSNLSTVTSLVMGATAAWAVYRGAMLLSAGANTVLGATILSTARNVGVGAAAQVAFSAATGVATGAVRAFTLALLSNPFTAIAVGIASVVGAVVAYTSATNDATTATNAKMNADILASRQAARRAQIEAQLTGWNDKQRAAAIASIQANISAAKAHLTAADAALKHALAEQAAANAILKAQKAAGTGPATGRGGTKSLAQSNVDKTTAEVKKAEENRKRAEEELKGTEAALKQMQAMIAKTKPAAIATPKITPAETKSDKKDKGDDKKANDAKKYADAVKNLNDRIKDLTLSEEQKALADELERAGLARDVTQVNEKANAIKDLFKTLRAGEQQAKVTEVLKDFNEKVRELTYSEEQLAMVEARRRAGLSADLSVVTDQTKVVDAQAAAYFRLQKAKENAQAVKDIERDQAQRGQDIAVDNNARMNSDKAEDERRILQIQRERDANIEKIRQLEGINEAKRAELILNEQNLAKQLEQGVAMDRQAQGAAALANFLTAMWDGPKQAFKTFISGVLKGLLEAIAKAIILGDKLGGKGGIGGLLTSVITGALSGSTGSVPGRASGGSVRANQWTLVGENGPELMKFGAAGTIMNNRTARNALGAGGGNVTIGGTSIIVQGNASESSLNQMRAQLDAHQRSMRAMVRDELKKQR